MSFFPRIRPSVWPSLPIALGVAALFGAFAGRLIPHVPVTSDALDYQHVAEHLVCYHTYLDISEDRLIYPPITSFFLAFLFAVQGGIVAYPLVYFVQMLCVGVAAWLVYLLAKRLTKHELLSVLSGGLILVWPYLLLYTQIVGSEILYVVLLAASVLSFVFGLDHLTKKCAIVTGMLFGLAILTRPVALLLPIGIALFLGFFMLLHWIPLQKSILRFSSIVILASIATLIPWTAYVGYRFHRFIPVASNLGFVLEKANKTLTYLPQHIGKDGQEVSTSEMLRAKARNLVYFWDPGAGGENVVRLTQRYPAAALGLTLYKLGFFVLLALAAVGVWLGRKQTKILVITSVILYVWGVHTVLFPFPRYTMPIHPLMIVLAAYAASQLLPYVRLPLGLHSRQK